MRLGAIVHSIAYDKVTDEEDRKLCHLVEFMAKISKAVHGNVFEDFLSASDPQTCQLTVLEEAIDLLTVIGRNFAGKLDAKVMSETMRILRYYAVIVFCRDGKFEIADIVMKRQWCYWKNSVEIEKRSQLSRLINAKKVVCIPHNNQSVVDSVRQLLAPIMAEKPFLVNIGQEVAQMLTGLESAEHASMTPDEKFDVMSIDEVVLHSAPILPKNVASIAAIDQKHVPDFSDDITSPKRVKQTPEVDQPKSIIVGDSQSTTDGEDTPSRGSALVLEKSARVEPSNHDCHIDSDDATSELSINFEETFTGPSSSFQKSKRGKKTPWGKDEEVLVYQGVQFYGVGSWAEIARKYLPNRTNVDVKDKWRTMSKQNKLAELAKMYGPLYK
jgi:Myb-like DNA-binding domain